MYVYLSEKTKKLLVFSLMFFHQQHSENDMLMSIIRNTMSGSQADLNWNNFVDLKDGEAELISGGSYQSRKYSQGDDTVLQVFGPGGVESVLGKGYGSFLQDSGSILIVEF